MTKRNPIAPAPRSVMTQRDLLKASVPGALTAGILATGTDMIASPESNAAAMPPRSKVGPLNILFLVADDLGPRLGCLNTPGLPTPVLDALAARGTLCHNDFSSFPLWSSSWNSILTGTNPASRSFLHAQLIQRRSLCSAARPYTGASGAMGG